MQKEGENCSGRVEPKKSRRKLTRRIEGNWQEESKETVQEESKENDFPMITGIADAKLIERIKSMYHFFRSQCFIDHFTIKSYDLPESEDEQTFSIYFFFKEKNKKKYKNSFNFH